MATALSDALFGTRGYTEGAQYQLPRKIPLRIEPKTFFANERTYLSWLAMATTLGSVGTAIAGFVYKDPSGKEKGIISKGTVELITMTTLPISIAMIAYALYTFWKRSEYIRKKQVGFFDNQVGAIAAAGTVILCLLLIFFSAVHDIITNQ